jgi:hypothetical protein
MGDDLAAGVQNLDEKSKFNRNLDFNSHSSTKIKVYCLEPHARKFAILFVRMYMYYYYTLMWNFNYINMSDKSYVIKFVE